MPNEPEQSAVYRDAEERKLREGLAKEIGDARGEHIPVENIVPPFDNPPNPVPALEPPQTSPASAKVYGSSKETILSKLHDWYRGAVLGKSRNVPSHPLYEGKKQRLQEIAGDDFKIVEKD